MVTPADNGLRPRIDATAGDDADSVRILIVDDDPALRRTFPHALARPGRLFDECGSIGEAIGRLEKQRYALILLDYRLPDANGLALLDWLSDHQRDEAVIIISGEDAIDAAIGALRGGADDYVRKPYHVAQLQRAVDGALHKGTLERANKLMSQRLKDSERLHRYLVESSPDMIFTLDGSGRFMADGTTGLPIPDANGKPYPGTSVAAAQTRDQNRWKILDTNDKDASGKSCANDPEDPDGGMTGRIALCEAAVDVLQQRASTQPLAAASRQAVADQVRQLLSWALAAAEVFASWSTAGGEGLARMVHVKRLRARLHQLR